MAMLTRFRDLFRTTTPRAHNDSLRAGVFDDVTPLAVLMRRPPPSIRNKAPWRQTLPGACLWVPRGPLRGVAWRLKLLLNERMNAHDFR